MVNGYQISKLHTLYGLWHILDVWSFYDPPNGKKGLLFLFSFRGLIFMPRLHVLLFINAPNNLSPSSSNSQSVDELIIDFVQCKIFVTSFKC